jgi:hypothetical protein
LGFREGTVANADRAAATTRVAYTDADAVPYAAIIARHLRAPGSPVLADPSTRALAGRRAEVVVTVGRA